MERQPDCPNYRDYLLKAVMTDRQSFNDKLSDELTQLDQTNQELKSG